MIETTKITRKILEKYGFIKIEQLCFGYEHASAYYQKKIESPRHIYYFINVYEYDFSKYDDVPYDVDYTICVQYRRNAQIYDISLSVDSVDEIEPICYEFYVRMDFEPYETKSDNERFVEILASEQVDLDQECQQIINDNFDELI